MKKPTILFYAIAVSILLMPFATQTAFSDAEPPEWKVGYTWNYEYRAINTSVNLTIEIIDMTIIEINDVPYEVYVVNITSIAMINQNQYQFIDYKDKYILKSNLGTIKEETSHIGPAGPDDYFKGDATFEPFKKEYDFPLLVDKSWVSSYTENLSLEGMGTYLSSRNINYSVIAEESVTVAAGTFECYKIEIDYGSDIKYQLWYSEKVKNMVKTTRFAEGIPYAVELTAYSFEEMEDEDSDDTSTEDLLPYILILIIVIIIIVVIVAKKRKKSKKKKKKKKKKKSVSSEEKKEDSESED